MIPSDLASRLRLLTESIVQPVSPASEVPADLPQFNAGQRFMARIDAVLPDGTYRALVAGKALTLSLPQSAKAGDSLELVVTGRTPRLIVAMRADEPTASQNPPATLSRAGQLISLLFSSRDAAPARTAVGPLDPLLPQPTGQAAPLAAALRQSIAESGLFYESHQAQWVTGRLPLAQLMREPQGQHSTPAARMTDGARPASAAQSAAQSAVSTEPPAAGGTDARPHSTNSLPMPPDLLPIIQQQLDAVATGQLLWQGEIWPGQKLDWEIEAGERDSAEQETDADAREWLTRIKLTLPGLGPVDAAVKLTSTGVSVDLSAAPQSLATLRGAQAELANALSNAGLTVSALRIIGHELA